MMWARAAMYYYPANPGNTPAPAAVTKETLSEALHAAIDKNDIEAARAALEESFWRKIVFTPDVFHLCRALHKQDRDLVRLLGTYGVSLNDDEKKAATEFLAKKEIDPEPLLRNTGISLIPSDTSLRKDHEVLAGEIAMMVARKSLKASFDKIGLGKKTKEILAGVTSASLDAAQTHAVIDDLAKSIKTGEVPADYVTALHLLRQTGADFGKIDPNLFLGKKTPGFAKALLDAGVVTADAFDMRILSKKIGGEIKIFTAPEDKNFAYTEFLCQVSLEIADPARFIKLRERPDSERQYQQHFCDRWMKSNNADLTYRLKGPKP